MNNFVFDPVNGLMDKGVFPSNPQSEEAARQQFMILFNQIKDYINKTINVEIDKKIGIDKFESSKGDNGYRLSGDGFIENYGIVTGVTNSWKTVRYAKEFANKCVNIQLTEIADTGGATQTFIQSSTANRKDLFTFKHEGSTERTFYYRAIGY